MPHVTFVHFDGSTRTLALRKGQSLMLAAVGEDIAGIDAECGGACNCATCHIFVARDWLGRIPPADRQEQEILAEIAVHDERSRLACQIELTDDLDGLTVFTPENQGW